MTPTLAPNGPSPIIGLPACARILNNHLQHATPARYAAAITGGAHAIPIMIPPIGPAALPLLDHLHGLLLTGSPSNVEPHHYDCTDDETPDFHDPARDATTFPLIHEALRRDMPILAICRGIQELNVALGGTLHQRVHLLPGRDDHQGQGATREEQYAPRHEVTLSGTLARLLDAPTIKVNSIHGQALDRIAPTLEVEAVAQDGTIEAVRIPTATFALGLQWHPEWNFADNRDSVTLFAAFGAACRAYALRSAQ